MMEKFRTNELESTEMSHKFDTFIGNKALYLY